MTASVITNLVPDYDEMLLGATPYKLEIKGEPEPRVRVTELMDLETGTKTVRIIAKASEGVPALALSTLDAIARRILPNARVKATGKGTAGMHREYAAS